MQQRHFVAYNGADGNARTRGGGFVHAVALAAAAMFAIASAPLYAQVKLHVDSGGKIEETLLPKDVRGLRSVNLGGSVVAGGSFEGETAGMALLATVSGPPTANAYVVQTNEAVPYLLGPPVGARFNSGKVVVFGRAVGNLQNGGRLQFRFGVQAVLSNGKTVSDAQEATVVDRAGTEVVEVQASLALPPDVDSTRDIQLLLTSMIDLRMSNQGLNAETRKATAFDGIPTGFAVFDASGKQVTGFTMTHASGLQVRERSVTPPGIAWAIEFYYENMQNYFVTVDPKEVANLELERSSQWKRVGDAFKVYTNNRVGTTGICRFYNANPDFRGDFAHQFVPVGAECDLLKRSTEWQYEGIAFYAPLPDAKSNCPTGHVPVYLVAQVAPGFSPAYRLTTSREEILRMMDENGFAGGNVFLCAPL